MDIGQKVIKKKSFELSAQVSLATKKATKKSNSCIYDTLFTTTFLFLSLRKMNNIHINRYFYDIISDLEITSDITIFHILIR